ncbi:MAG: hypothetical protein DHS20C01_31860 [marine bacterium B5-7]|nr:MAG: hypothetical protein DHS20C01_31860 [marine bacterium B5-7]
MNSSEQEKLNRYFSTTWLERDRSLDKYTYTGWALVGQVKPGETVLDVGCGSNPFKDRLDVTGIDPANPKADYQVSIETFQSEQLFDIAFCLGSINFGSREDIRGQIRKVASHLKPVSRIYWRCNPGLHDHSNSEFESIVVYPWTFKDHDRLAAENGYRVSQAAWDAGNRIYAVWERG